MKDFILENFELSLTVAFIALGYIFGTIAEKRHYSSIRKREKEQITRPTITLGKSIIPQTGVKEVILVGGSVVISIDYFKRFVAALVNLFGGRISSYETLVDRGRREAILRLKEVAPDADLICNLRIETSSVGKSANRKGSVGCIEVFAYGTAVWLE